MHDQRRLPQKRNLGDFWPGAHMTGPEVLAREGLQSGQITAHEPQPQPPAGLDPPQDRDL
jgi:hypothetical protein